jgi:hypothetical protein
MEQKVVDDEELGCFLRAPFFKTANMGKAGRCGQVNAGGHIGSISVGAGESAQEKNNDSLWRSVIANSKNRAQAEA